MTQPRVHLVVKRHFTTFRVKQSSEQPRRCSACFAIFPTCLRCTFASIYHEAWSLSLSLFLRRFSSLVSPLGPTPCWHGVARLTELFANRVCARSRCPPCGLSDRGERGREGGLSLSRCVERTGGDEHACPSRGNGTTWREARDGMRLIFLVPCSLERDTVNILFSNPTIFVLIGWGWIFQAEIIGNNCK